MNPDLQSLVEISDAMSRMGGAVCAQLRSLVGAYYAPGDDAMEGIELNANAVAMIERDLVPVLDQHAPDQADELREAIAAWRVVWA